MHGSRWGLLVSWRQRRGLLLLLLIPLLVALRGILLRRSISNLLRCVIGLHDHWLGWRRLQVLRRGLRLLVDRLTPVALLLIALRVCWLMIG